MLCFFRETAIAGVRASVMVYDDGGKRWIPAGQGGQHGESKVQLFQHLRVTTYRIVARKGPDHEVSALFFLCALTFDIQRMITDVNIEFVWIPLSGRALVAQKHLSNQSCI